MPPKRAAVRLQPQPAVAVAPQAKTAAAARPASSLPSPLRFPLLVIISLSLSAFLYSIAADVTGYELAGVSRSLNETWQAVALLAWKVTELGVAWYFEYDDIDLISLTILSRFPYLFLLSSFYQVSIQTSALCLIIDIAGTALPFRLLRARAPTHQPSAPRSLVPNRAIIQDLPVRAMTSLLAAAVYATTLFTALRSWLPVHLAVHFDGLRSLEPAHDADLLRLLAAFLPLGWAAREFIFTPTTAANAARAVVVIDLDDENERPSKKTRAFDPVTASLAETVRHNLVFWDSWDAHTKALVQRTAVLTLFQGLNTWVQSFGTVEGVDIQGAAGWASLWATAGLVTGMMFGWVGGEA